MAIKDDLLKHQVFILRLAGAHAGLITATLNQALRLAIQKIEENPAGLSKQGILKLENDLGRALKNLPIIQLEALSKLAKYEVSFIVNRLQNNNIVENPLIPNDNLINEMVYNTKIRVIADENKKQLPKVYNTFVDNKKQEIIRSVKDFNSDPEKGSDIKDKLLLLGAGLFAAQALTLSSTAAVHVASEARETVYEENKIPLVEWVSELDGDVCPDCEELHGTQWPVDEAEIPPEHWNCRCVLEPVNE